MPGVTTQVSAPKIGTDWTTALKKNSDTRGAAPYLLRIRITLCHTTRTLSRFMSTAGHSSSAAEITHPKYLKEVTISRWRPYALKALELTALSYSAARCHIFYSAPSLNCEVRQCIPFRACHGTSMPHRGHRGWERFPSSNITTVGSNI